MISKMKRHVYEIQDNGEVVYEGHIFVPCPHSPMEVYGKRVYLLEEDIKKAREMFFGDLVGKKIVLERKLHKIDHQIETLKKGDAR